MIMIRIPSKKYLKIPLDLLGRMIHNERTFRAHKKGLTMKITTKRIGKNLVMVHINNTLKGIYPDHTRLIDIVNAEKFMAKRCKGVKTGVISFYGKGSKEI